MSQELVTIINEIKQNIVSEQLESIEDNLNLLPIEDIPKQQCNSLLEIFLSQAMRSKKHNSCKRIIATFNILRCKTDIVPTLVDIFTMNLQKDLVSFVIESHPNKSPVEYLVDLVNLDDDKLAITLANNICDYFEDISEEDWKLLLHLTEDVDNVKYHNPLFRCFIQSKIVKDTLPSWIKRFPVIGLNDKSFLYPSYIPSVKEAVDLLVEDFLRLGLNSNSHEELKNFMIAQYAVATSSERILLLSSIKKLPSFDDSNIFKEFGPVNSILTTNTNLIEPEHQCSKYGGCRMLLCCEFEENDTYNSGSFDDEQPDWFKGSCDICSKTIKNRYLSLRLPLCNGGWINCYCSFDCMKCDVDDPVTATMVGRIKQQLNDIGIRDR